MKIVDVEQGSQEWLNLRRAKITATDCPAIMEVSEYKSPRMVWLDKMGDSPLDDPTPAMERGRNLEPFARSHFNETNGMNFVPVVGISSTEKWQMASFDGVYDNANLEIKCPSMSRMDRYRSGEIHQQYLYQVYHQMMVLKECTRACLFFFHPDCAPIEIWVYKDQAFLNHSVMILKEEHDFYHNYVLQFREPFPKKMDVKVREDSEWECRTKSWKKAKEDLERAKIEEEICKQRVFEISDARYTCKGNGVSVSKVIRQGTVDYTKIPELKDMDLEIFRKPKTEYWNVRSVKD